INDLKKCGYSKDNCELNFKFLNNLQAEGKKYATMMRQNKNIIDINIDALYNILKQNQEDVNDAMGSKKKTVVVTSDPLALIAEKTNVSKSKEKVVVSSDSEGSETDDFNELKKITASLTKAFNRRKFYSKPTNNNLRTSSSYQSANKKQEFVKTDTKKVEKKDDEKKRDISRVKCYNCKKEGHFAKDCKKAKVKDCEYYKTKILLAKKDKDEQVLLAKDQAWMESSSDSDQEINANMVFMAQIKKVLSDPEASSSSADEKISEEKYAKLKAERYEYMIRYSAYFDNDKQHRKQIAVQQVLKGIGFENLSYFEKAKDLRPTLYHEKQTSSLKPYVPNVIPEKIIIDLEDEVVSLLEKERANLEIIKSLKSKGFESSETVSSESKNQSENDCHVVEKQCGNMESSKVIAPGMFKLNVSQCVSPISMSKSSYLDTFSSIRRPKNSGVVWKKKGSSNTSNDDDLLDDNNFFIFDDVNVTISPVRKLPFRKKPCDSMHVPSKSNSNKSLPRTVHKWLPKLQPLAEPIVQIYLWIIDSGCSKHMTGNRALLTNFVEKFIGTIRFGNNDFAVIAGYGDVAIGSMTIKKVYYVEGLGHNLFSVGQFCDKGLEVAFRKSTCFVRNEDGVDLLTEFKNKTLAKFFDEVGITQQFSAARTPQQNGVVERRNRTLVKAARTMLTFANLPLFLWTEAIATTCFIQNRSIIHKRFEKTPYEFINKRKPNIKFFRVFECRCYLLNDYEDVGKLKAKGDIGVFVGYSKESATFRIYNKRTRKIHESVNVNFDEISEMASKQFSLEPSLSNLIEMGNLQIYQFHKLMKLQRKIWKIYFKIFMMSI
nr:retrovirus-related Pol polyprotein from transposon TNT 1-94 [Tanacetum cinerariifolium]